MATLINTLKSAEAFGKVGTDNAKMPGTDFSLPPSECAIGSKLAKIPGSVCHGCYAAKSERIYTSARVGWQNNSQKARLFLSYDSADTWARAIAHQIKHHLARFNENRHRWFGAGDLQSVDMLRAIVQVCELTPEVRHWLPTREAKIVADWRAAGGTEPANLVIRISSTMIGDQPRNASHTSTVHRDGEQASGHICPERTAAHRARNGGRGCGDCSACWSRDVGNVSYPFH